MPVERTEKKRKAGGPGKKGKVFADHSTMLSIIERVNVSEDMQIEKKLSRMAYIKDVQQKQDHKQEHKRQLKQDELEDAKRRLKQKNKKPAQKQKEEEPASSHGKKKVKFAV